MVIVKYSSCVIYILNVLKTVIIKIIKTVCPCDTKTEAHPILHWTRIPRYCWCDGIVVFPLLQQNCALRKCSLMLKRWRCLIDKEMKMPWSLKMPDLIKSYNRHARGGSPRLVKCIYISLRLVGKVVLLTLICKLEISVVNEWIIHKALDKSYALNFKGTWRALEEQFAQSLFLDNTVILTYLLFC